MKLKQFFEKHSKQIMIVLFVLFAIKTFQSCNRNSEIVATKAKMVQMQDSLDLKLDAARDSMLKLQSELKLANFSAESAEKRANAVQSTAEKITRNTTIQIKNNAKDEKQ